MPNIFQEEIVWKSKGFLIFALEILVIWATRAGGPDLKWPFTTKSDGHFKQENLMNLSFTGGVHWSEYKEE